MSVRILTYKQFSSIVPKETKDFVDKFLLRLGSFDNILSKGKSNDIDVIKAKCIRDLFIYMYNNYDSSISNALHREYDIMFPDTASSFENNQKNENTNIEDTFNMINGIFCFLESKSEYYYLTPETILFNNLRLLERKWSVIKDTTIGESVIDIVPASSTMSTLEEEEKLSVESEKLKLENDTFSDLLPETILFLKKANGIYSYLFKESYNEFDLASISLFLAFYKMDNLKFIIDYFSTINFENFQSIRKVLDKIGCDIYIPDMNSSSFSSYNIGALVFRFKPYIDELKKIENESPKDIINMLFDRKISNSSICEQIFRYNNPDLDLTKINEEIEVYLNNKKSLVTDEIYKNLPLKTCVYIEFVSKIVYILREKNENMNLNICYSDSEIIDIAILISSFYKDNQITSYLSKNNITIDRILNYLNLSKEDLNLDIDKENCDIVEVYNWFKKNNFSQTTDIQNIISRTLDEKVLNKILSDLGENNKSSKSAIEKYIKEGNEQKRIDLLSKFYGDLNIDIVKILESSYIYYKYLLNCRKYYDLTNDDLIQISLLVTIYKICEDDLSKYIYNKLFDSGILSKLINTTSINVDNKKNIFNENIDAKELCKYFGKYIFGGKNKDKLKNDITINDILNNIFNKDLNYSIKMKNFLNVFNLSYDDFENLNNKYEEYLQNQLIKHNTKIEEKVLNKIRNYGEFDIINDLDKLSRSLATKNKASISAVILIYMYYRENSFSKYLIDKGITLDKIINYLNLDKDKIDKFKDLDTDYEHIHINLDYDFIFYNNFDGIIKYIFCNSERFARSKEIITNLGGDFDIIKYEIENEKKYVPPLTKEEKLDEYLKMPVPKIEIKSVEEISNFGLELSSQSEFISQTFHEFIENYSDESAQVSDLQEDFKGIYKEKTKARKLKIFSRKIEDNPSFNKKDILDRLDNYLKSKEKSLNDGLKELQYIRSLIAAYLQKANIYLKELQSAKEKLMLEISNKEYYENDFRIFDDNLKKQLLDDKISSMNMSILQMIQQYQRITMQMGTHAAIINQVNLARSSTIQNLYIELSLREGIEKEKDSISSLNNLIGLLGNMSVMNSNDMINNINKINMLNKSEESIITDKDKILIHQILDEQNILKLEDESNKS